MKRLLGVCSCFVLLFASCASTGNPEKSALAVADLVDQGQTERLTSISAVPFLVDREIVSLPSDVATFWKSLRTAGFHVAKSSILRIFSADSEGIKAFGTSFEVKAFFSKYVDPKATIVELVAADGRKFLLVVREKGPDTILYGFKGTY